MIGAASTFVGSVAHTGRSESWVPDTEPPIIGWTASSRWAQALSELLQCWRSSGEIIFQVISTLLGNDVTLPVKMLCDLHSFLPPESPALPIDEGDSLVTF